MQWTKKDPPISMRNLPQDIRTKAIEIANFLAEETNMDEGTRIATAIRRAKGWEATHGKKPEPPKNKSRESDAKEHDQGRHVTPAEDGWAVKTEGSARQEKYPTKK